MKKIKLKIKEIIDKNQKMMPLVLVLFLGGLFVLYNNINWSDNNTKSVSTAIEGLPENKKTEYATIEKIIADYKQKPFDSSWLSTTVTQINSSFSDVADVEKNLNQSAVTASEQKVFDLCENYLLGNKGTSPVLNKYLKQLQNYGDTNPKIGFYQNQMSAKNYYTKNLVFAINTFTSDPFGFELSKKKELVGKANQMGGLNAKYITSSIKRLRNDMLYVLDEVHTQSAQVNPQSVKKISYQN
jgi:hypothetical protein